MINLQIIFGSTRDARQGGVVAQWVLERAQVLKGVAVEFIDLKEWNFPMFNEAHMPRLQKYSSELIKRWSTTIASADAYVVITPEYNHGYPAVLKNAIDHLYKEWNRKPIAFVGYSSGVLGGVRAIEQLRPVAADLEMADIRESVTVGSVGSAFEEGRPVDDEYNKRLDILFEQLLWWAQALKHAREKV